MADRNKVNYLLRGVDREVWSQVKTAAFDDYTTIRIFIVNLIEQELNRRTKNATEGKNSRRENSDTTEEHF